jgi:hypothetical protein
MIDPATGLEIPDAIAPAQRIPSYLPGGMPDDVAPTDLVTSPLPLNVPGVLMGTTGSVLPAVPARVDNPGIVPGLPSTRMDAAVSTAPPVSAPVVPVTASPVAAAAPVTTEVKGPRTVSSIEGEIRAASRDAQSAALAHGEAIKEGADAEVEARRQQIASDQAALAQHRETTKQVQAEIEKINEHQRSVLEEAHKTTIPDFWNGRFGAEVAGAVSMALGEAGRALTAFGTGVNVGNAAKEIIDTKIKQYYQLKQQEVENKFKYAASMAELGHQEKIDLGQQLTNLQFEMAATHQSAADHILEVAAQSKGRIATASALEIVSQEKKQAVELIQKARENQARIGIESYNAKTSRMHEIDQREKAKAAADGGEKTAVFDDSGKQIGHVTGGKGGAQAFMARDADYTRAEDQLKALAEDIRTNGVRVLTPEAIKRRQTLKENADIAVATVSPLGKTDEAMKKESGSIGAGGDPMHPLGFLAGANPEAVEKKIHELQTQKERYRQQGLIGYQGGQSAEPAKLVTIRNAKTGETKQVSEQEARQLGAL